MIIIEYVQYSISYHKFIGYEREVAPVCFLLKVELTAN